SSHVGTLSIVVADGWREVGIGSTMVRAAQEWTAASGLLKLGLAVFPDNARAIAVYEHAGFAREGLRRRQYRGEGGVLRDELLMAWFPPGSEA
ncbi:MAG TPA: GNAT family protein, partial [Candidatus Limnocylindria bacterium]|nr:GNAT family protein [Candidatus Limnocylindria bacterium]